jgi:hypothetical protein
LFFPLTKSFHQNSIANRGNPNSSGSNYSDHTVTQRQRLFTPNDTYSSSQPPSFVVPTGSLIRSQSYGYHQGLKSLPPPNVSLSMGYINNHNNSNNNPNNQNNNHNSTVTSTNKKSSVAKLKRMLDTTYRRPSQRRHITTLLYPPNFQDHIHNHPNHPAFSSNSTSSSSPSLSSFSTERSQALTSLGIQRASQQLVDAFPLPQGIVYHIITLNYYY